MKILLAGDSTVASCPAEEFPMSGWGAHLPRHVYHWGAVHNFARGGATTESFRHDGHWQALLARAVPGDLVVLQFGHNDQKLAHLAADGGYAANLRTLVAEARDVGARPILCTSVERRNFVAGRQWPTLADYAAAVRTVGADLDVPVLDLHTWTSRLYATAGEVASVRYFTHLAPGTHAHWPAGLSDNTHFSTAGAAAVAAQVAVELAAWAPQPTVLARTTSSGS